MCAALDGHEDYFYGNHVVLTGGDVGGFACDGPGKTVLHDNAYYTKDGKITECKMDLAAWQAKGEDAGPPSPPGPRTPTLSRWRRRSWASECGVCT